MPGRGSLCLLSLSLSVCVPSLSPSVSPSVGSSVVSLCLCLHVRVERRTAAGLVCFAWLFPGVDTETLPMIPVGFITNRVLCPRAVFLVWVCVVLGFGSCVSHVRTATLLSCRREKFMGEGMDGKIKILIVVSKFLDLQVYVAFRMYVDYRTKYGYSSIYVQQYMCAFLCMIQQQTSPFYVCWKQECRHAGTASTALGLYAPPASRTIRVTWLTISCSPLHHPAYGCTPENVQSLPLSLLACVLNCCTTVGGSKSSQPLAPAAARA